MRDMNKKRTRLSETQSDVLYVLMLFELNGKNGPVASTALFGMVNKARPINRQVFASNFRASCHSLVDKFALKKFRSPSLKLAFSLSDEGRQLAQQVYNRRHETVNHAAHG